MRPFCLLIALLCRVAILLAQPANEPGYARYTRTEGLSNNVIHGIVQDSLGYIWIATSKGLNRFDGHSFTAFYTGSPRMPLPDNAIEDLVMQDNELLASTHVGSFAYNTSTRSFRKLLVTADPAISAWTNIIQTTIRDNHGHYLLSSKTGFYVFDSSGAIINRYDHYKPSDARRIELDFSSWFKQLENGTVIHENNLFYSAYDPKTNRVDTFYGIKRPGFKELITDRNAGARFVYPGRKNEIFIINEEQSSVDVYDFADSKLYPSKMPFKTSVNLGGYTRFIYLCDTLLAVTGKITGFYIFRIDPVTRQLTQQGEKLFGDRFCNTVFRDREGRLWVGTTDGLYKQILANPFFRTTDLGQKDPELRDASVRCISGNEKYLFVGLKNNGGMLMLEKSSGNIVHHFDFTAFGPDCNTVYNLLRFAPDTLWVGTRKGILLVDTRSFQISRIPLPDSLRWMEETNLICIMDDHRGKIWFSFGRYNSIAYFDRAAKRFTFLPEEKNPLLRLTFCFSMACDRQGNVWFGGDGIVRWNRAKQSIDTLITETSVGPKKSSYFAILDRDSSNNLWLYSYNNGIIQYNCDSNSVILRREEGDFSDWHIVSSSPIIYDQIWMGMDNGIASFSIRNYSNRLYTYSDGLPSAYITTLRKGSWYDTSENNFYLGAGHHIISFHPDSARLQEAPPKIFIDEVSTKREIFPRNQEQVALSYFDNSLLVDFNAVNFSSPEDSRFAYRVRHRADSSWQLLDWQHSVNFSNLAPGKYELDVKLFSADNRWPDQLKHLSIIVNYPFWRTWWFICLGCLLAGGLIWFISRRRISQIREKAAIDQQLAEFEMKALHAQMNPHFIFNALNGIKQMILHEDNRNASLYLSKFAHLIRLTLEHSRKTFIPLEQQIEYLESYLQMERLRFDDFSYEIGVFGSPDTHEIHIAPMLLQPLVENAIWHGLLPKNGEKHLNISFFAEEHQLICAIEDNGIGINHSLERKNPRNPLHASLGIENIRERMAVLNEKYHIHCSLQIKDKSDIPGSSGTGTITKLIIRS